MVSYTTLKDVYFQFYQFQKQNIHLQQKNARFVAKFCGKEESESWWTTGVEKASEWQ